MHPCRPCGACCAHLGVVFHEDHLNRALRGKVQPARAKHHVAMKRRASGACVALEGKVGRHTGCGVYAHRPGPCADFVPSWEQGERNPHCDNARVDAGLPRLTTADW